METINFGSFPRSGNHYFVDVASKLLVNTKVVWHEHKVFFFDKAKKCCRNEDEVINGISDWEAHYGAFRGQRCLRTSYNNNIRKQYAGVGYAYDAVKDQFVAPQPYASWTLDANNDWQAPTSKPEGNYYWNEESLS